MHTEEKSKLTTLMRTKQIILEETIADTKARKGKFIL
jgi:hypothetical protein